MTFTISQTLEHLAQKQDLSQEQMTWAMHDIMTGNWLNEQVSAFLMGLRSKGETVTEISAAAQVMRELSASVQVEHPHLIDTCGTGGDGAHLFNVSTAVSFVVAAAGGAVAKHGNRSLSSKSGAADVLEEAGVYLNLSPAQIKICIETLGVGFMYAPLHHSAMKYAMPARKALGIRTLFNILGPLTNPAQVPYQLMGVYDDQLVRPIAEVLQNLGLKRAVVVHGHGGLDEFSISGSSKYALLDNGTITEAVLTPEDVGLKSAPLDSLVVAGPSESLGIIKQAFKKESQDVDDPARDIIALNAGSALFVSGVCQTMKLGVELAQDIMASGAAAERLSTLVNTTGVFKIEAEDGVELD